MNQMFFGNSRVMLFAPDGGSTPPTEPSPYFTYDSNRVITGLHPGSPNVYEEGTYLDTQDSEEKPYSGWTYGGGSNLVEDYATAIGDQAFENSAYFVDYIPPSKAIDGNITFQNVTSVGFSAFDNCNGLESMMLPNVMNIKNGAFSYCSTLNNVTIGSGIQGIGYNAFETQGDPITLTIGKTVAEVQAMGTTDYEYSTNVPYSDWGLPSGSTIVCTKNETIPIP